MLGLVAAVPVLLWQWRHDPLPTTWEPHRWWTLAGRGFIHPDVVPNAVAVATWLIWAQLVLALLREAAAQVRRGASAARSALVLPPVQELACRWVAAATVALSVASRPEAAGPLAALVTGPPAAVATINQPPSHTDHATNPTTNPTPNPTANTTGHGAGGLYVCERYDTLRSLAERFYDDADMWAVIRDASVGLAQPDGQRLAPGFVVVEEGTRLRVPALDQPVTYMPTSHARSTTGLPKHTDARAHADRRLTPSHPQHTVMTGDTLWDIAEAAYPRARPGDLPRVAKAIFEVNKGVGDGQGRVLRDPDLINPGMLLRLPDLRPSEGAPARAGAEASARTTPPPTPGGPNPRQASPSPEAETAPQSPPQPTPQSPPGTPPATSSAPTASPTPTSLGGVPGTPPASPSDERPAPIAPLPAWVTATMLATVFAGLWAYRRRRRDSTITPGNVVPPPDPARARVQAAVLRNEDPEGLRRLDSALRHLAAQHRGEPDAPRHHWSDPFPSANPSAKCGCPVPQVILRKPDGDLEVFLREPRTDPPEPWVAGPDPRVWVLPRTAAIPGPRNPKTDSMPGPCPTLVQLGTTDDGAELYVDLEAIGVLAISAATTADAGTGRRPDGAEIRGIARAVTATLATSPLAGVPTIATAGFDPFGLADEERVLPADSIDDLIDRVADCAEFVEGGLRDCAVDSTFALRAVWPGENWDPYVAIVGQAPLDDADAERLASAAGGGGRGIAVVLPASPAVRTPWRLILEQPDRPAWRLEPLKITVTPVSMAAEELNDLTELLAEASAPPVPATSASQPAQPVRPAQPDRGDHDPGTVDGGGSDEVPLAGQAAEETPPDPEWQVMVRLLGPLDIVGRDGRTPTGELRDRTLEVIAWLVTHRHRATRADLVDAVWPDGVRSSTVTNVLGKARNVLAQLAGREAQAWIPAYQSQLRIHPALTSDLEQMQTLVGYAERNRARPQAAIRALRRALELVRGTPVRYSWADAELGSTLVTVPVAAAVLLAELCLEEGDIGGVLDATARGLALLPAHSELFALRMKARAAAGDIDGVRAEYDAYVRAELADPLYDDEPNRKLEQLHQDLVRSARRNGHSASPDRQGQRP